MHFQGKQKILDIGNGSVNTPAKGKNLEVSHVLNLVVNKRDSSLDKICEPANQKPHQNGSDL